MRGKFSTRRLLTAAVLVAALGSASVAAALAQSGPATNGAEPVATSPGQAGNVDTEELSVLQDKGEVLIAPAPAGAQPGDENVTALSLGLAQDGIEHPVPAHVINRVGAQPITVAEVEAEVCVGVESISTCGPPSAANSGELIAVELCGPELPVGTSRIVGLAPNGVGTVSVGTSDGSTKAAGVTSNAFERTVVGVPDKVSWTSQSGRAEAVPTPVPADFSFEGCSH